MQPVSSRRRLESVDGAALRNVSLLCRVERQRVSAVGIARLAGDEGMRILSVHNYYQQRGGEDEVFESEARMLEARGHAVISYVARNEDVARLPRHRLALGAVWSRAQAVRLRDAVVRAEPHVVHFHNTFPLISPAAHAAVKSAGAAVVQTLHNYRVVCAGATLFRDGTVCRDCVGRALPWPALAHRCYRGSFTETTVSAAVIAVHRAFGTWTGCVDRFIAPSDAVKAELVRGGLSAERIVVKPHFVRGGLAPGAGEGGFALYVGRLSPEKGVGTLLDAWGRLPEPVPLKIVGDGPCAGRVEEAARRCPQIELLGQRSKPEVEALMREAAVVLVPSLCPETFGLVAVEALASGTPVIASAIGALPEVLADGVSGFLVTPGDTVGLAETVASFMTQRACVSAMRLAARRAFEARYTEQSNYEQLMGIYHDAVAHAATAMRSRRSYGGVPTGR